MAKSNNRNSDKENFVAKNEENPVNFSITKNQRETLESRVNFWHELDDKKNHNRSLVKILRNVSDLKPLFDEMLGSEKEEIYHFFEKLLLFM